MSYDVVINAREQRCRFILCPAHFFVFLFPGFRLMLLLQSLNAHAEVILGVRRRGSQSRAAPPSVSIGLVVRRYWQNLLHLSCLHLKEVRVSIQIAFLVRFRAGCLIFFATCVFDPGPGSF